jgi:thymidylate synthase
MSSVLIISADSADEAYSRLIPTILCHGREVCSRLGKTLELHPLIVEITNPRDRIITNPTRLLNPAFLVAEMLWILSGSDQVDFLDSYNSRMKHFSDDGKTLHGAYGKRLRHWKSSDNHEIDQIAECRNLLTESIDTRQAEMVLFDPAQDFEVPRSKNIPCNNLLKFTVRDGKLDLTLYIRSNDAILGFPYDAHHWMCLQELMADWINVDVGTYYHIADSMHIYEKDYQWAEKISQTKTPQISEYARIESPCISWESFTHLTGEIPEVNNMIINGNDNAHFKMLTSHYWEDAISIMKFYVAFKNGSYDRATGICKEIGHEPFQRLCERWYQVKGAK